jgi:hypothetical protein
VFPPFSYMADSMITRFFDIIPSIDGAGTR